MLVMLLHIGYKKDSEIAGKLVIDVDAAKIVKSIFKLKLQGKTSKEIADIFNKEDIKTPSEYLQIKGLENRTRKIWTRHIISRILNNEVYIGKSLRGKSQNISYKSKKRVYIRRNEQIVTENTHEAIISVESYNQVHKNNKYGNIKNQGKPLDTKFFEFMYCGECKKKMARRRSRNYINIHCSSRNETDTLCKNKKLYIYEDLEKEILKDIQKKFDFYFKNNKVNPSILKKHNDKKVDTIKDELKNIDKELKMLKFKISKLYNDRLIEKITEESYKNEYSKLTKRRDEINKIKEKLENKMQEIYGEYIDIDKYKRVKRILKKLKNDDLKIEELKELIERIEINNDSICIFYRFENMIK